MTQDAPSLFDLLNAEEDAPTETPQKKAPEYLSVTELTKELKDTLRNEFSKIYVRGEIADYKGSHRSGHLYFALKDDASQIRAVMWKGQASKVPFKIENGLEVLARGKLDYYGASGSLQIVLDNMEPVGIGSLQLRFEQLKAQLQKEGLFSPERKKAIPKISYRIGVVTSKSTAAFQDILKVLKGRFPLAEVFLFHAAVQGENAPKEIIAAIDAAEIFSKTLDHPLDALLISRGGGSYEDLFCFNDEALARRIAACNLPTVTGIGHEIDVTIADWVADLRAATPSHAAQLLTPDVEEWKRHLKQISGDLESLVLSSIENLRQKTENLTKVLHARAPQTRLQMEKQKLYNLQDRLKSLVLDHIKMKRFRIEKAASSLHSLSPLQVLDRGYSFVKVQKENTEILRNTKQVQIGDILNIRVKDGEIESVVKKITEGTK